MADKKQPKAKKARPEKYEKPLKVNGSFLDIVKAAGKEAAKKNAPKKP